MWLVFQKVYQLVMMRKSFVLPLVKGLLTPQPQSPDFKVPIVSAGM